MCDASMQASLPTCVLYAAIQGSIDCMLLDRSLFVLQQNSKSACAIGGRTGLIEEIRLANKLCHAWQSFAENRVKHRNSMAPSPLRQFEYTEEIRLARCHIPCYSIVPVWVRYVRCIYEYTIQLLKKRSRRNGGSNRGPLACGFVNYQMSYKIVPVRDVRSVRCTYETAG